eukprot:16442018-Heterocapsa_arctica.AAC.1
MLELCAFMPELWASIFETPCVSSMLQLCGFMYNLPTQCLRIFASLQGLCSRWRQGRRAGIAAAEAIVINKLCK